MTVLGPPGTRVGIVSIVMLVSYARPGDEALVEEASRWKASLNVSSMQTLVSLTMTSTRRRCRGRRRTTLWGREGRCGVAVTTPGPVALLDADVSPSFTSDGLDRPASVRDRRDWLIARVSGRTA
jgi:hypothetical protein